MLYDDTRLVKMVLKHDIPYLLSVADIPCQDQTAQSVISCGDHATRNCVVVASNLAM